MAVYKKITKYIESSKSRWRRQPYKIEEEIVTDAVYRNYIDPSQTRFFNSLIPNSSRTMRGDEYTYVLLDPHNGDDMRRVEFHPINDASMYNEGGDRERAIVLGMHSGEVTHEGGRELYRLFAPKNDGSFDDYTAVWDATNKKWVG